MKKIVTFKNAMLLASVVFALSTGLLSCTDNNSNTSEVNEGDSANLSDNTNSTSPISNEKDKIMNDSTLNNGNGGSNYIANDEAFMVKAAEINREEIKLGKLAQQKGTKSHVKDLGKMMVAEHTKAMSELTAMAKTKSVNLPTNESEKLTEEYKMLNEKSGKDFDQAYSDMMVNGHKEAISLFENTHKSTTDTDVKSMAAAMIPKLKKHLDHSEKCQKECQKQ